MADGDTPPKPIKLAAEAAAKLGGGRVRPDTLVLVLVGLIGSGAVGHNTLSTRDSVSEVVLEFRTFKKELTDKVDSTNTAVGEIKGQILVFEKAKIEERMRDLERTTAESRVASEELRERVKTLEEQARRKQ